jgi:hypothetical protein
MAMNLIDFFHYFEGNWRVTDLATGTVGSLKIRLGTGGVCHILEIEIGGVQRSELRGMTRPTVAGRRLGSVRTGSDFPR